MKKRYLAILLTMVMAVCLITANIPQVSAEGEQQEKIDGNPIDEETETELTDELYLDDLVWTIEYADELKAADGWDDVEESLKTEFYAAYNDAKAILTKATDDPTTVTQDEIDTADDRLWFAILDLIIPDKEDLSVLIAEAEKIEKNESKYTAETFKVFKEALVDARAVLADENAADEDIYIAYYDLAVAMDSLKEVETQSVPSTPQSNSTSSGAPVPKTGDEFSAVILVALLASGVALVSFKKRNQH